MEATVTVSKKLLIEENVRVAPLYSTNSDGYLLRDQWIECEEFARYNPNDNVSISTSHGMVALRLSPFSYDKETGMLFLTVIFK